MEHLVLGVVYDAASVSCDAFDCFRSMLVDTRWYTVSKVVGQVMSSNGPSLARNTDVKIDCVVRQVVLYSAVQAHA